METSNELVQRSATSAGAGTPPVRAVWVTALAGPSMMVAALPTFGGSAYTPTARLGQILLGGGSLVLALCLLVTGVLVISWLARARRVAAGWSATRPRLSAGWAVASWFVPLGNLWLPAIVVTDLVRASDPGRAADGGSILDGRIRLWWAAWLGSGVAPWLWLPVAALVTSVEYSPEAMGTAAAVVRATLQLGMVLYEVLLIAAAAHFARVLRQIAAWQEQRLNAD